MGGQTIYYDKWFKNGVRFINDLVKDNGEFFSYQDSPVVTRKEFSMWNVSKKDF